jgi:hypothetical protein
MVLGVALIAGGIGALGGVAGWAMAVAGLLPLTLGVIDGCILAPVLQVPFKGSALRARQAQGRTSHS